MFETKLLRTKQLASEQHKDLEKAVFEWFKKQRLYNVPVSGPMLIEKTQLLAEGLKMEDFKCSASWVLGFRQRHNIGFGKMAGEGKSTIYFKRSSRTCFRCHDDVWPGYYRDENFELIDSDNDDILFDLLQEFGKKL